MASCYPSGTRFAVTDEPQDWASLLRPAIAEIEAAPAIDECHHCGAPSPGSRCRYCNTVRASVDAAPGRPVFG